MNPDLIITVHGIQTFGQWQERLERLVRAQAPEVRFIHYRYGFFSLLAYASIVFRWLATKRFGRELAAILAHYPEARVRIVCHSFGTHLVGWTLHSLPQVLAGRIDTVILAGSVLKPGFRWEPLLERRVLRRMINDCGTRDYVLVVNQLVVPFAGAAGYLGFTGMTGESLLNRYFEGGHSLYFLREGQADDRFMARYWMPLLTADGAPEYVDERRTKGLAQAAWLTLIPFLDPAKLCVLAWLSWLAYYHGYALPHTQVEQAGVEAARARETAADEAVRRRVQASLAQLDAGSNIEVPIAELGRVLANDARGKWGHLAPVLSYWIPRLGSASTVVAGMKDTSAFYWRGKAYVVLDRAAQAFGPHPIQWVVKDSATPTLFVLDAVHTVHVLAEGRLQSRQSYALRPGSAAPKSAEGAGSSHRVFDPDEFYGKRGSKEWQTLAPIAINPVRLAVSADATLLHVIGRSLTAMARGQEELWAITFDTRSKASYSVRLTGVETRTVGFQDGCRAVVVEHGDSRSEVRFDKGTIAHSPKRAREPIAARYVFGADWSKLLGAGCHSPGAYDVDPFGAVRPAPEFAFPAARSELSLWKEAARMPIHVRWRKWQSAAVEDFMQMPARLPVSAEARDTIARLLHRLRGVEGPSYLVHHAPSGTSYVLFMRGHAHGRAWSICDPEGLRDENKCAHFYFDGDYGNRDVNRLRVSDDGRFVVVLGMQDALPTRIVSPTNRIQWGIPDPVSPSNPAVFDAASERLALETSTGIAIVDLPELAKGPRGAASEKAIVRLDGRLVGFAGPRLIVRHGEERIAALDRSGKVAWISSPLGLSAGGNLRCSLGGDGVLTVYNDTQLRLLWSETGNSLSGVLDFSSAAPRVWAEFSARNPFIAAVERTRDGLIAATVQAELTRKNLSNIHETILVREPPVNAQALPGLLKNLSEYTGISTEDGTPLDLFPSPRKQ